MTPDTLSLLLVIAPISLLDSTSITPLCIVPLIMLLSGEQPILRSSAFLFGIFITYLVASLLILFGLEQFFDQINAVVRKQLKNPDTIFLVVQIGIGAGMVFFGSTMTDARQGRKDRRPGESVSATQAFMAGAAFTIVGLPGALPLFAAIDQILRADPAIEVKFLAMVFYNVLFILPLGCAVGIRIVIGDASVPLLKRVNEVVSRWARRFVIVGLVVAGIILILDGIGWFMGHPLLPV